MAEITCYVSEIAYFTKQQLDELLANLPPPPEAEMVYVHIPPMPAGFSGDLFDWIIDNLEDKTAK